MFVLIGVLVFLVVLVLSVAFGCWWPLVAMLIATVVISGLHGAWHLSGTGPIGAGAGAWWTANQARVIRAALIFVIIAALFTLLWVTAKRFAPSCGGLALPCAGGVATTTTVVAPATSATTYVPGGEALIDRVGKE